MNAEEVPSLLDENERLREELGEEMLESGQLTIERDEARETVDDLTRSMSDLAADLLIEGERADNAVAELAAARRVVQAVEALRDEWSAQGSRTLGTLADQLTRALACPGPRCPECNHEPGCACADTPTPHGCSRCLAGPGPTPEPAARCGTNFGVHQHRGCPGPTDDERPATGKQR